MNKWREMYQEKLTTAKGIAKLINSGDYCVSNSLVAEPCAILEALAQRAEEENLAGIVHTLLNPMRDQLYLKPSMSQRIRHSSLFLGKFTRELVWEGYADYVPGFYSEQPRNVQRRREIDVFYATVSPMDQHGYFSFSTSADMSDLAGKAKKVFLEVNSTAPRIHGNCFIHISRATAICESQVPITEVICDEITDVDRAVGAYVAAEIPDGACIQLGIGGMPNAVAQALMDKRDLGVHSEMFTESMMDLIEAGVINNSKKNVHRGKCLSTFTYGSRRLYDFLDDNPCIEFAPVSYVNNPYLISQNDNMISVNSCMEVDLFGQVCAESIGPKNYSGVGGQIDFVRGTMNSKGGKSFIVMSSTAQGGKISKIKSVLTTGNIVTTTRNDVDNIVTEYGIARLRGKNIFERAKALIAIAHPNFRQELIKEAQELHLIRKGETGDKNGF
ncbi:MAG: acetyl-CoA hydrolase/transferase family protein [Dehalobacterium sp.]|jgi:4-hydroxybutyrate CoA-transferase